MNNCSLIGRLTKDVELRYSASQTAVGRFSLAVDRVGRERGTDFLNITVFGRLAEQCEKYLHKGDRCGIEGRIQTGSYEKDGRKIYTTDIIAHRVDFLMTKRREDGEDLGFATVEEEMPF